jgi:hypothetical protein
LGQVRNAVSDTALFLPIREDGSRGQQPVLQDFQGILMLTKAEELCSKISSVLEYELGGEHGVSCAPHTLSEF